MKLSGNTTEMLSSLQVFNRKNSDDWISELLKYGTKFSSRNSSSKKKANTNKGPFYDFLSEIKYEAIGFDEFSANEFAHSGIERVIDNFNSVKKETNMSFSYDYKELMDKQSRNRYSIPDKRIYNGYEAGMIDFVSNAIVKTKNGWINQNGDMVLEEDATIEDVLEFSKGISNILPSFSLRELEEIEDQGVLIINGEVIAKKDEQGGWLTYSDNFGGRSLVKFASGDIVRLIAHSDIEVAIYGFQQKESLYHGNVTKSIKKEDQHISRKNISMQGDGLYSTGSISEAVKIYANFKSFEVSGKLLDEYNKGLLDKKDFVFGHVYETSTSAACYSVSFKPEHINILSIPSLSAFVAVAKSVGESEVYFANQWLKCKDKNSSFEVYAAINRVNSVSPRNNIFYKMFSSLGFEGVDIEFPKKELLKNLIDSIVELENMDDSYFEGTGISKNYVLDDFNIQLEEVMESVPAKAEVRHNITFDSLLVSKNHLKLLPINNNSYTEQLEIYRVDGDKLSLDDVLSLKSPDYKDIKNYWSKNKERERESMSINFT